MKNKKFLLELARKAIEKYVRKGKILELPKNVPEEFNKKKGVFVSIYKNSELRGCIGFPYPEKNLIEALVEAAILATRDFRFEPLKEDELDKISIEISILTKPKKIEAKNYKELLNKIEPLKDGIIVKKGSKSALFLPQVWNVLKEKEDFLSQLCLKAGLEQFEWLNKDIEFYKFRAKIISE
ncbi:MAG: AmmeMemoRadiSam system protein A [Candidatus Aenigmarchaeota archaeon]|nr:AmmeMemoRadiSam system protein A [Candidatus Aenigmarchaeota archaeon]MDW8149157.1 AmmeMemoRadiSam system protein A [Candidatus Aenigmarchaeota archaeon]